MTKTRAERVSFARQLSGLERKEFHAKHNIPVNTLRSWESPSIDRNGITTKGAKRLSECLYNEGIICSVEWLLYGTGNQPKVISILDTDSGYCSDEESIIKEANFFKKLNKNSLVQTITDNYMLPFYAKNDLVGGISVDSNTSLPKPGYNYILTLHDSTIIRKVFFDCDTGETIAISTNPQKPASKVIKPEQISGFAEIIWHRRK